MCCRCDLTEQCEEGETVLTKTMAHESVLTSIHSSTSSILYKYMHTHIYGMALWNISNSLHCKHEYYDTIFIRGVFWSSVCNVAMCFSEFQNMPQNIVNNYDNYLINVKSRVNNSRELTLGKMIKVLWPELLQLETNSTVLTQAW